MGVAGSVWVHEVLLARTLPLFAAVGAVQVQQAAFGWYFKLSNTAAPATAPFPLTCGGGARHTFHWECTKKEAILGSTTTAHLKQCRIGAGAQDEEVIGSCARDPTCCSGDQGGSGCGVGLLHQQTISRRGGVVNLPRGRRKAGGTREKEQRCVQNYFLQRTTDASTTVMPPAVTYKPPEVTVMPDETPRGPEGTNALPVPSTCKSRGNGGQPAKS